MKALKILAKRLAFGVVSAWGVLTAVFLLFSLTNDWVGERIENDVIWANSTPGTDRSREEIVELAEEALAEYSASRGLDRPLHERYLDWLRRMVTLDWGDSLSTGEPVFPLVMGAVKQTATYVIPAVVLAVSIGLLIGLRVAVHPDSHLANGGRITSYLLFGVPSFWLGGMYVGAAQGGYLGYNELLATTVFPTVLVTMTLLGGYISYSRAYVLEHVASQFIMLVKAKGASPRVVAKHLVRNAAIPLFSMLLTEVLGLLVLSIFVVEMVFGIDGFGLTFFRAIDSRDIPVLLGCTMVIIVVGVLGNVVQDLSYHYLDPRVDEGK